MDVVTRRIWICPDCGRSYWPGLQPSEWKGSTIHVVDPRSSSSGNCEGMPNEHIAAPIGDVREGWMVNVTARRVFVENFPAATIDFEKPADRYLDEYQVVVVVRPRGDAS